MLMFDNSGPGNDCWIHEYWYWCEPLQVAVKVCRVSGDFNSDPQAVVYTDPLDYLPEPVKQWFAKDAAPQE